MSMTIEDTPLTSVDEGRRRIDGVDAELRALIERRRELSGQIQALRLAEGGPRIQHTRESQVIGSWATELGSPGADIARALLTICRGRS